MKSLEDFNIAFMMSNPFIDRWDYQESSYGSWKVIQSVAITNNRTIENIIDTHLCNDTELNEFNSGMSESYKQMIGQFSL